MGKDRTEEDYWTAWADDPEFYVAETVEEAEERLRANKALILGDIMMRTAERAVGQQPQPPSDSNEPATNPNDWLYVEDIREIFGCGESKARGILQTLPSVRIGRRNAVMRKHLDDYIAKHGGVVAKWPKRKR